MSDRSQQTPAASGSATSAALTSIAAASMALLLTGCLAAQSAEAGAPSAEGSSDAPKNVIYMIGDGMGYNHVAATNLYESGQTKYQVEGEADPDTLEELPAEPVQGYEEWDSVAMSTYPEGGSYDGEEAWSDREYVNEGFTDSAAAGTAMATGTKTENGKIGVDSSGEPLENLSERAIDTGRSAGVVTTVPFNHATPAAWAAHNADRDDYTGMATEMIDGDLDVIMGAGHPEYDDDAEHLDTPDYEYLSEEDYDRVSSGETDFDFIEDNTDFEDLATGQSTAERVFGLAQAGSTLQYERDGSSDEVGGDEMNDLVDLSTMSQGALNTLSQNDDGFHLMIEGGAIDWAGHGNDTARDVEEVLDFNEAVDTVTQWVEENSSWEETLVIVTADHETGYLGGPDDDPDHSPMTGEPDETPEVSWSSEDHTNALVPVFYRGAGSDALTEKISGTDPVRGDYLDNTAIPEVLMEEFWVREEQ